MSEEKDPKDQEEKEPSRKYRMRWLTESLARGADNVSVGGRRYKAKPDGTFLIDEGDVPACRDAGLTVVL